METTKTKKIIEDHTWLSAKANDKSSTSTKNATSRATIDNNASKSPNTSTLKRKTLPDPDKENHNKLLSVNEPDGLNNQVAGPSSKALGWSSKNNLSRNPKTSDKDLRTQETPIEKLNDNGTEMRQPANQNPSKAIHSLDPKIIAQLARSPKFSKWYMLMQELQKEFDSSMFNKLVNTLVNKDNDCSAPQNNDPIAATSRNMTVEAQKSNTEKINEKLLEEKDTDDSDTGQAPKKKSYTTKNIKAFLPPINDTNHTEENDLNDDKKPPKKRSSPIRIEKVVLPPVYNADTSEEIDDFYFDDDDGDDINQPLKKLPPEYDANDSRWTLKYNKLVQGLVELMPDTCVYVKEFRLSNFKRFSTNSKCCNALARMLLIEIFTINALSICSLPGTRAKPIDSDGTNVRPALDRHAIKVLINYVIDHAKKEGWPIVDTRSILNSMRYRMKAVKCIEKVD